MKTPPPARPALVRAKDGSVRSASPVTAAFSVSTEDVAAAAKKAKKKNKAKADDIVELTVQLPKRDRKRLRKRAAELGWTADEAATHILHVWANG